MNGVIKYWFQTYMFIVVFHSHAFDHEFFTQIPSELVMKIFATMKDLHNLPWQAVTQFYKLKTVCKNWNKLLIDETISSLLNISPMAFAAAKGDVNEIIRLKTVDRCCIRKPDDTLNIPSAYAVGMRQESAIKLFQIVQAVKTDDERPCLTSAYIFKDIIEILKTNNTEAFIPMFLRNYNTKITLLNELSESNTESLWSQSGRDFIAFIKQALTEQSVFTCIKEHNRADMQDRVKRMIIVGGDINAYDTDGYTLLHKACISSNAYLVKVLLKYSSIKINCKTVDTKATPLHMAATYNNVAVIRALLAFNNGAGNDIGTINGSGYTPLSSAVIADCARAMRLLIRRDSDITFLDEFGNGLIHFAAYFNSVRCISFLLLKYGYMINSQNKCNFTPLMYAVSRKHFDMIKILIDAGADLNKRNDDGHTALHFASNIDIVRTLCIHGADPNIDTFLDISQQHVGYTPLLYAAYQGNLDIIKVLIEYGARIDVQTTSGKTAQSIAWKKGYDHIVDYLNQQHL